MWSRDDKIIVAVQNGYPGGIENLARQEMWNGNVDVLRYRNIEVSQKFEEMDDHERDQVSYSGTGQWGNDSLSVRNNKPDHPE